MYICAKEKSNSHGLTLALSLSSMYLVTLSAITLLVLCQIEIKEQVIYDL